MNDRVWANAPEDTNYFGVYTSQFDPTQNYHKIWSRYGKLFDRINGTSKDVADATKMYSNVGNRQILSYIDPSQTNEAGMFIPKYVVYDPSNDSFTEYTNAGDMESALGLEEDDVPTLSEIQATPWQRIGNQDYAVYEDITTPYGKNTILINKNNGGLYLNRKTAEGEVVTPELITDMDKLKQIISNPNGNYDNEFLDDLTAWN